MKSTRRESAIQPETNGEPEPRGDAHEPETVRDADLEFDPAALEAQAAEAPAIAGPDPFDPAALRLPQDYNASLGVRKALLSVPVRKPDKSWFVRVHPSEDYRIQTCVIELKEDRETYLVAPQLRDDLAAEATYKLKLFATAINRQGVLFLWEANLPRPDGRLDEWTRTALEGLNRAEKRWVRLSANMALGAYDLYEGVGSLSEPEWPAVPFRDLLELAFKDRYIADLNHPVLRRLRGEV